MKEWYLHRGERIYHCPYCKSEIGDCTGDKINTREEYCGVCGQYFMLVVLNY